MSTTAPTGVGRRRALMLAPVGLAAAAGVGFWVILGRMRSGDYDPHGIPSPLLGKPLPDFTLPPLASATGFSTADVRAAGHAVLINFFASWCIPCVQEAPELNALKAQGIPIWGINYKDKPDAAGAFLQRHGNPYARIATDAPGTTAINFGLYGVPETYFIDRTGIVRWRWAGPLTADISAQQLQPLLRRYA